MGQGRKEGQGRRQGCQSSRGSKGEGCTGCRASVRVGGFLWLLRPGSCTARHPLTLSCPNSEEEASIASAKPKAPKAGASKAAAKKPAALAASKDASPKTSAPGTPRRGEIPDFDDAMNAPLESFSASNIVRTVWLRARWPGPPADPLQPCRARTTPLRSSRWSARRTTRPLLARELRKRWM